jgi:hypothetical protein
VVIPSWRFGTTYLAHLQGSRIEEKKNKKKEEEEEEKEKKEEENLGFLTIEDRTDKSFRNFGKELPLLAA